MTEVQDRRKKTVEASMTEQVHLIMQQHLNGRGRLFRGALMQRLDLPERLSPNALLDVLNGLMSREEFLELYRKP